MWNMQKIQTIYKIKCDINIEKLQNITLNQGYSQEFNGEPKLISKQQSPKGHAQSKENKNGYKLSCFEVDFLLQS